MSMRFVAFAALLIAIAPAAFPSRVQAAGFDAAQSRELDRLVRDACGKEVVLLGESAGHGGARSIEIKTEVVKRLVARCGFRGVLFETSLFEAIAENRLAAKGESAPEKFTDAMGQTWFWASEAQPLRDYLFAERAAGKLRVGGIDVQPIGITARLSRERLADELATLLPEARRAQCREEMDRHQRWAYDKAHPFDAAAKQRLLACIDAVAVAGKQRPAADPLAIMAASHGRYGEMMAAKRSDDPLVLQREQGMADALLWQRAQWPKGTRIVVWTASSHAAKFPQKSGGVPPLGALLRDALGSRVMAIGVSALGGSVGNMGGRGDPVAIAPAASDSLEARTLHDGAPMRYLDRRQLQRHGDIEARVLAYNAPLRLRWDTLLDGMLLFREERPIVPIKP